VSQSSYGNSFAPSSFVSMLRLALPVLAEQLLTMLVGYTDWWLAGHYLQDASYLAAMGLMAYILWLLPSMYSAIAIGATSLVAQYVGAGEMQRARHVANQAVTIGVVFSVIMTLATVWGGSWFVSTMQLKDEAADHALQYLWFLVPVLPAIMIEQVGVACLYGAGDTLSGFVVKTIVNLINVGVSMTFVIGWGPFPRLGWDGLAIGTVCGHGVGGLMILGLLLNGRAGLLLQGKLLRPRRSIMIRLLRIGVPGGLDTALILVCHLFFVGIVNRLGTLAAASHGLGVTIESMAYLPGIAFQVAATTMVGQSLGANRPLRAARSAWMACGVACLFMMSVGLIFYFAPHALTSFFTGNGNSPTALGTVPLLRIVAWAMPSLAVLMVLTGALRGAGDTRWPLAVTLVGFLGIRLPGACLLAWSEISLPFSGYALHGLGWGVIGAWYAMLADTIVRSLLILARFWHGGWRRAKVTTSIKE